MVTKQTKSNRKYEQANAEQGIVAVRVFVPQTKREKLLELARKWRDDIRKGK